MKMLKNSGLAVGIAVSLCLHGLFFLYVNKKAEPEEEHAAKYKVTLSYAAIPPVAAEKTQAQKKEDILEQPRVDDEKMPEEQEHIEPEPEIRVEKPAEPPLLPEDVQEEELKPQEMSVPEETPEKKQEQERTQVPQQEEGAEERKTDVKSTAEVIVQEKLPEEGSLAFAVTGEPEKIDEPVSGMESPPQWTPDEAPPASDRGKERLLQEDIPDLSHVFDALRERIVQKRVYPPVARKRGYEGTVVVLITLDAGGDLSALVVAESSGYKVLDKAAVALIKRVLPYEHNTGKSISVEIPITYELVE